jgi:elongation factor P
VKIQHTQPGKGGAYMQVEMKNLIDGRKNNVRFRSAETVERSGWTPRLPVPVRRG